MEFSKGNFSSLQTEFLTEGCVEAIEPQAAIQVTVSALLMT
jgi:hypothetical protein